MQKIKEQKGITLIALVITIIVMLILVGVTVSVSLNGGLFTTAKEATNETQIAQEKEELLMATLGVLNENGKVDLGKLDSSLPEGFTGSNGEYTSKTGNVFTVTEDGNIRLEGSGETSVTEYTAYSIGDTITIETETFYVIADSDETNPNLTLLAKDNINTTTLVQDASAEAVAFSTESYWGSGTSPYDIVEPEATLDETTGKLTLPASHTVAKAAYDYGRDLGGTGRLMTYSEATALETANSDILYGTNGKSSSTYLKYWLGSADYSDKVLGVYGSGGIDGLSYDYTTWFGCRPVVEISKAVIQ